MPIWAVTPPSMPNGTRRTAGARLLGTPAKSSIESPTALSAKSTRRRPRRGNPGPTFRARGEDLRLGRWPNAHRERAQRGPPAGGITMRTTPPPEGGSAVDADTDVLQRLVARGSTLGVDVEYFRAMGGSKGDET